MRITIICLILLLFSVWYVPFRLKRLEVLKRMLPLQAVMVLVLASFLGMLIQGIYTSTSLFAAVVYNILWLLLLFHVYLFMFLAAANMLHPLLKRLPGKAVAATGISACLFFVGLGFFQAQSFTVTNHEIKVNGLTSPVSIMHIPDLHLGMQRGEGYLKNVISAIARKKPDIVIYNGDLVDSDMALRPELFALFKSIDAEQYFTTGNHEFYLDIKRVLELVKNSGLRILRSEMVESHGLQIIGLEYMNADRTTYDSHRVNDLTIEEELPKIHRSAERPVVLAHHSPVGVRYVAQGKVDVMLSGHTHGGQVFPGNILVELLFPATKGRYQIGDMTLLVSQGAGTFGPMMRLSTFNELQFVKLVPVN